MISEIQITLTTTLDFGDTLRNHIMDFDFLLKVLVIGDSSTGKSCILHRYLQQTFKPSTSHTIGVEFGSKIIKIEERTIKLQIWDTAGQERFRSVTRSYYRNAAGALLVYDITKRETFESLKQWLIDTRSLASPHIQIVLVGNKMDLERERAVSFKEADQFAHDNGMTFVETSAVTGEGVEQAFMKCASSILTKVELGQISPETMSGIQYGTKSFHTLQTIDPVMTASRKSCCFK